MVVFDKCLALLFSFMILGQAYMVRRVVGTWLFPACLFGLFWFGYTFFPLAFLFWVPVDPYAIGFIFICAVALSLGSVPYHWKEAFARNEEKGDTAKLLYGSRFLSFAFYVSIPIAFGSLVLDTLAQGISLHDLIFNLIVSAATYRSMLTNDLGTVTIYTRLGPLFTFLAVILGGLRYRTIRTRAGRLCTIFLSFGPPVFLAVAQSSKGSIFASIVFFYAGILVWELSTGRRRLFREGSIRAFALWAVVLLVITLVSFLSRGLYAERQESVVVHQMVSLVASYSCGHVYAFSDWFSFAVGGRSAIHYAHQGLSYGFYTFMPLAKMLGSTKEVPNGIFVEPFQYKDLLYGNIYTIFRGLILDFGFIGAIVFFFLIGLVLHLAFHVMLWNKRPSFSVAVFIMMMGYFYFSFIISGLIWTRIYLIFFGLWFLLQANNWITLPGRRQLTMSNAASHGATSL